MRSSSGLPYGVWFVVLRFAVWRLVCRPLVCRNSPQKEKTSFPWLFFSCRPKTSSMSKNQTGMPAGVKRPAAEPADPPPRLPLPLAAPALVLLPNAFTGQSCKIHAQILLSKVIIGFAKLTAHHGIELVPPPKNNAQREHVQLDQSLELKRAFVIFVNKGNPSAKMAASTMLRPKKNCRDSSIEFR